MRWALIFLFSAGIQLMYVPVRSFITISTSACRIDIQWSFRNYTEFYIAIKNANDKNFSFNLETTAYDFMYTGKPGQTYKIVWMPIENRVRVYSLKDEEDAMILKDCDRPPVTASKDVGNSEFDCSSVSSNIPSRNKGTTDIRIDAVHSTISLPDTKRGDNSLFSEGFCEIYFWTSLLTIPLAVCIITTLIYLIAMRKPRGPVQNGNVSPQVRRFNAKSTCYANADVTNEYDEVQYSLADNTDI